MTAALVLLVLAALAYLAFGLWVLAILTYDEVSCWLQDRADLRAWLHRQEEIRARRRFPLASAR